MTYPGNQSLASDVQLRIRSTFEHTLGLAEKGSRQEALLGCDFVLRMDPLFEPARRLQERLEAATGPLAVDDLRSIKAAPAGSASSASASAGQPPAATAGKAAAPDTLWPDLDGLAGELPDLPEPPPGALRAEFETLLAERRFQELQIRARAEAAAVTGDLELQRLASLAQERLEAGPYVSKFLLSARDAMRNGNAAEANRLLDKARTLDPTHPGIAELTASAPSAPGAPAGAAGASRREPELQTMPISGLPRAGAMAPGSAAPSLFPASPGVSAAPPPPPLAPMPAMAPVPAPAGQSDERGVPRQATGGAAATDTESERRIQQLLDEGQAALDGGDPQAAIDAWSRIFLIDIDHQEAAHRIEMARRMKAERDRQVEETFHDGLAHLTANDPAGARAAFQRVLELQPGHLQSREYLQQLDEGGMPAVTGAGRAGISRTHAAMAMPAADALSPRGQGGDRAPAGAGDTLPPLPAGLARAAGAEAVDLAADQDLQEEILVPPDVSPAGARAPEARREVRSASAAPHAGRARRLFLAVGSAVLLLVLAVGWFLYQKREQWFPNSRTEEPAQPPAPNPIPRAIKLHDSGKAAIALAQLSRVPAGDPHYKEAQALIAKWQAEPADGGAGAPGSPGATLGAPAPGTASLSGAPGSIGTAGSTSAPGAASPDAERRRALIEEAGRAFQEGAYLRAAERYEAADKLAKLDTGEAAQFNTAKQKLVPLQRQIAMFRSHDWDFALPELWRIHESEPGNRDVTRMIVDSYYNLGVRNLLHNEVAKAAQQFGEAKNLAPDDLEIKRQLVFAQTYLERNPDLLYRIYVKYLPIR
ncbi:MAG TPA: hypothetical protein VHG32_11840 [Thermoanaerobaculia bacterium]|nr:hypothetical protein [Thermoanaerobaculia bacterium]